MRRMIIVMALAVIAVLLTAPAVQAQYLPQEWGYVHANLASTRYNLARIWEDGNRESDRIWANSAYRESLSNARNFGFGYYGSSYYGGYPSYYGAPYAYGSAYGSAYGTGYGRVGYRGRGNRHGYHRGATQNNVNAWGALNLGASVIGTVVSEVRADRRHNEEMAAIRESERNVASIQEERAQQVMEQESASAPLAIVYNGTGECLQVNGVIMDKGSKLTVRNPNSMQVATESGSACKVYAEGIGDGILLTCRK